MVAAEEREALGWFIAGLFPGNLAWRQSAGRNEFQRSKRSQSGGPKLVSDWADAALTWRWLNIPRPHYPPCSKAHFSPVLLLFSLTSFQYITRAAGTRFPLFLPLLSLQSPGAGLTIFIYTITICILRRPSSPTLYTPHCCTQKSFIPSGQRSPPEQKNKQIFFHPSTFQSINTSSNTRRQKMRANAILVSTAAALMAAAPVAALDSNKVAHHGGVAARAASSYQDNPDSFDADTMPQGYTYSGSSFATPTETPNYKTIVPSATATTGAATGTAAVNTPDSNGNKGTATTTSNNDNSNGAATHTPDVNSQSNGGTGTETASDKTKSSTDDSSSSGGMATKTKSSDSSSKTSDSSSSSSTSDSDSSSSSSGSSATPSASSTGAAVHAAGVQMGVLSGAVVGALGWLLAVF
ncbi:hypothetical protein IWX90DRAFT_107055 [Phyllosticta citrichinensis]|uniref:Uncharacterized protein n=1 Tax=Phyllosticta citrichinensis TaxID=1130410 RepID=A0ABR1Y2G4_9PEZI